MNSQEKGKGRDGEVAAFGLGPSRVTGDYAYSERQLALVRARMPMKVGTKIVDAETRTTSAVYMIYPLARATGHGRDCGALLLLGDWVNVISAGGTEILTQPSRSLA
jgi:hypothetical protein